MIKVLFLFTIVFTQTPAALAAAGGGDVGNSGGFALCKDGKYFSYDVLITANLNIRDRQVTNVEQNLEFIYQQLVRLKDPLAQNFKEFFSTMYKQGSGAKYRWLPRKGLRLMWQPELEGLLPRECRTRKQAVVYFPPYNATDIPTYSYDPELIALVKSQPAGPLQVSYLWVHEWLWNFLRPEDFMTLARFNRILHSVNLSEMKVTEYLKHRPEPTRKRP